MGYIEGEGAHFHTEFRNPDTGELVDPTIILFKYEKPDGTQVTLTLGSSSQLTKTSTGRYLAEVDFDASGIWSFRWDTSAPYNGADEFTRQVAASRFT